MRNQELVVFQGDDILYILSGFLATKGPVLRQSLDCGTIHHELRTDYSRHVFSTWF
jgi:hypothetical protein